MRTTVRFVCDRCGQEFSTHQECSAHEKVCGDYPQSGLYRVETDGVLSFVRVDRDAMTMMTVTPYPFWFREESLIRWCHGDEAVPVGDAMALLEIKKVLSGYEDAVYQSLRLPPFDKGAVQ